MNIIFPGLNFSLSFLFLSFRNAVASNAPGHEPMKPEGHQEFGHDDADDEDEGDIEDNGGCDAAYAVCVDGAYFDDLGETLANLAVAEAIEKISYIGAPDFLVQCSIAELVEDGWVVDLRRIQPCQQVEIQNISTIRSLQNRLHTLNKQRNFSMNSGEHANQRGPRRSPVNCNKLVSPQSSYGTRIHYMVQQTHSGCSIHPV